MIDDKNISSQTLQQQQEENILNYVKDSLNEEQRHALEMEMLENEFMTDAVEGLQQYNDKQSITDVVKNLNHQLIKQTTKYKVRKHKRKIPEQTLVIISIAIILLLCLLGYWFIKKLES